jgi:lysozyme
VIPHLSTTREELDSQGLKPGQPSKALVSLVGACAAALLYTVIPAEEGLRYDPYFDILHILTVCYGDTKNVVLDHHYTNMECFDRLDRQLIAHSAPLLKCTPQLKNRPYQLVASVSLAYNIGVSGYCNSRTARLFRLGRTSEGCDAMMGWLKQKELINRRKQEVALCKMELA